MRVAAQRGERLRDAVLSPSADSRSTPMTPVEATSTSSGRHPIWRATNSTVERATCHARVSGARVRASAVADDRLARGRRISRDSSRETRTGAACVLFVVNTAAADTGRSAVISITSSGQACVGGLMPAYTPAALKPAGAVMPPSIVWIRVSVRAAALDMQLSGGLDLGRRIEVGHHRELFAPPEQRAAPAVGRDLLRQPGVRNNRKAHVREIRRLMGEHTQIVVAGRSRADSAARRRCGGRGPVRAVSR